jgi:RimJ/RimL family protein N-acetyltransferase
MTAEIRTERLLMRRWQEQDRAPFAAMNADPTVMRYVPRTLSREESDAFVDRIEAGFEQRGYGLWAVELEGAFAGYVGLAWHVFEDGGEEELEVGWRLAERYWGLGIATEAGRAALSIGLEHEPTVVSVTAVVNEPSQRVMQRIGMRLHSEFEHMRLETGSPLRPHVRYVADRQTWRPHSVLA